MLEPESARLCHLSQLSIGSPEVRRAGLVCVFHLCVSIRGSRWLWSLNEWMWHTSASTQLPQDKCLMSSKDQEHARKTPALATFLACGEWAVKSLERGQQVRSLHSDLELGSEY